MHSYSILLHKKKALSQCGNVDREFGTSAQATVCIFLNEEVIKR